MLLLFRVPPVPVRSLLDRVGRATVVEGRPSGRIGDGARIRIGRALAGD